MRSGFFYGDVGLIGFDRISIGVSKILIDLVMIFRLIHLLVVGFSI